MKRSKILIPTVSALAVAPAIAITGCSKDNTEQNILDAVFGPMDLTETVEIDNFFTEFNRLSADEKQKELIYDTFGMFNYTFGTEGKGQINIRDLYKANEGAFKINIQKCNVTKENGKFYGSLLGYITYVFEKEHTLTLDLINDNDLAFKPNDYMMLTIDIVNAELMVDEDDFSVYWQPKLSVCSGFWKFKYEGGKEESLYPQVGWTTASLKVKNSHNWVPKE